MLHSSHLTGSHRVPQGPDWPCPGPPGVPAPRSWVPRGLVAPKGSVHFVNSLEALRPHLPQTHQDRCGQVCQRPAKIHPHTHCPSPLMGTAGVGQIQAAVIRQQCGHTSPPAAVSTARLKRESLEQHWESWGLPARRPACRLNSVTNLLCVLRQSPAPL